ncbi:hypothetical protein HKD37_15G043175 [Glycine soja]
MALIITKRKYDPSTIEFWLKEMKDIFEVVLTTMLKDEAKNWWKDTMERMMTLEILVIWENFKITFLDKYFSLQCQNPKVE